MTPILMVSVVVLVVANVLLWRLLHDQGERLEVLEAELRRWLQV